MNRDILRVIRSVMKYGFSNQSLRVILGIYIDNNCPLASTLRDYDMLDNQAVHVHTKFVGHKVTTTWYSRLDDVLQDNGDTNMKKSDGWHD